jgi:hypothetical protein
LGRRANARSAIATTERVLSHSRNHYDTEDFRVVPIPVDLGINRKACSRPTQGPPGISLINYLLTPIPASTRREQAAVFQREVDHA